MHHRHLVGVLALTVSTGAALDVLLHAHQGAVEHHRVSSGQRDAVGRSRRLHHQHPWVRLVLEPVDDLPPLGWADAAVNDVGADVLLGQVSMDRLDRAGEQREDDDLAGCLLEHLLQYRQARRGVELHHFLVVGVRCAAADLQKLAHSHACIDRADRLACGLEQHLILEQVVVLGLLGCKRYLTRHRDHRRQVQTLRLGKADGWLQRLEHGVLGIGLGHPLVHGQLVHHLVAPRCEELRHTLWVDQLGQTKRIHRRL